MAEGGEGPPVLSYTYKCENCKYEWEALSYQEIGLTCSQCQSLRIRPPDRRGTYKYKCDKCYMKWKKKNSTGGVSFCTECNGRHTYPYKFKPDPPKRKFGEFTCSQCNRSWKSGNAWEGKRQQCQDCGKWNLPQRLRPLRPPRFPLDGIKKPHPEDKCERCKELGYYCRNYSSAAATVDDDESVISTSDSSVDGNSTVEDGGDLTPVPSNHGSDIGDIDDLVDEIEHLGL